LTALANAPLDLGGMPVDSSMAEDLVIATVGVNVLEVR
jgi:hypothetical protein